jgi:hypothetical protein
MSKFKEVKRDGLRTQLDVVLKQLGVLYLKLSNDRSGSEGVKIQSEIDLLGEEAERLEKDIIDLEKELAHHVSAILPEARGAQQKQVARVREGVWEQDLHKIDYKKAKNRIIPILQGLSESAGEAFFLFHNADSFKGNLCVQFINEEFSGKCGSNLYPLEIALDSDLTCEGFSRKLAERLDVGDINPKQYLEQGLKKLSLTLSESVGCFLKVEILRKIDDENKLLPWLLEDFRKDLMQCLYAVRQTQRCFSFVFVISMRGSLPSRLAANEVDEKIGDFLKLPLENWQENDITQWMLRFSDLRLKEAECAEIAETLYDSFGGNPSNTYRGLFEECRSRSIGLSQSLAS